MGSSEHTTCRSKERVGGGGGGGDDTADNDEHTTCRRGCSSERGHGKDSSRLVQTLSDTRRGVQTAAKRNASAARLEAKRTVLVAKRNVSEANRWMRRTISKGTSRRGS